MIISGPNPKIYAKYHRKNPKNIHFHIHIHVMGMDTSKYPYPWHGYGYYMDTDMDTPKSIHGLSVPMPRHNPLLCIVQIQIVTDHSEGIGHQGEYVPE